MSYRESAAPDRTLLIVGFAERLFAVDRMNGDIRWEVAIGDDPGNAHQNIEIVIADGMVIAATHSELWFVEYTSGKVHAQIPFGGGDHKVARAVMVLDEGMLYVSGDGVVSCFTNRGQKVWTQPFKNKRNWGAVADVALGFPGNVRQADNN